ncbi:hypothetical protein L1049_008984 [Liquidambar formosana]|uniref:Uncharacterized protein n=1 Tax=Liquidambar formosana TaxID=63359 RepID=A0AAP0SAP1_LIQFO
MSGRHEKEKGVSEQERGSISGILTAVGAHASTLEILRVDHSGQAASINEKAQETFQQRYMQASTSYSHDPKLTRELITEPKPNYSWRIASGPRKMGF